MKTTVCTACVYPDTKPIRPLIESCKRFGVTLHPYGIGKPYGGFCDTKMRMLLEFLQDVRTSHVLYVDGTDTLWTAGLTKIKEAYRRIADEQGVRCVVGSEWILYPFGERGERYKARAARFGQDQKFIYHCPGIILSETQELKQILTALLARRERDTALKRDNPRLWDDDMTFWQLGLEEGLVNYGIDYRCEIAMVFGKLQPGMYVIEAGRVRNGITGTYPCILHFNRLRRGVVKKRMKEVAVALRYPIKVVPPRRGKRL